jgi:hypothetical protein
MRTRTLTLLATATLLFAPFAVACSSETADNARDTVDSATDDAATAADQTAARVAAEALRASLKANDTADEEGIRSVAAIEEATADLPGNPEISGVEDSDGDGLDDDGQVQVTVDDEQACISLPAEGEDTEVTGGACS